MGNSNSKAAKGIKSSSKGASGDSTSSSTPPFTRTDTSQSVRSTRSLRSLRSRRSESASTSAQGTPKMQPMSDSDTPPPPHNGSSTPTGRDSYRNHRGNQNSDYLTQDAANGSSDGNHLHPNSHMQPSTTPSRRRSSTKRASVGNADLPPSMVRMEPKSPILKNGNNYTVGNVLNYNENALTDEDDEEANNNDGSGRAKSQVDNVRRSHPSRPSSVRSGSSSRIRKRSDNAIPDSELLGGQQQAMSRSNSHASSHSRKSSTSAGNTAYSTPLNSPGVFAHGGSGSGNGSQDDYFGSATQSLTHHNNGSHSSDSVNKPPAEGSGSLHHLSMDGAALETGQSNAQHHHHHQDSNRNSIEGYPTALPADPELADGALDGLNESQQHGKKKKNHKPINIDETIQKLLDAGYAGKRTKNVCLKNSEISQICHLAREIFLSQPSLLELSPPVKIVGDVHGQYADLLRLFTKCGFPPAANYLFLGDYVDRGKQSLETILLLLCYKIKYPENFFLLRGNHECANVTRVYGFYDECKRRCNIKTWKIFIDTFNTLPLAAIVAGKIFCVHGGLSPVLNSMDEIRHFSRPTDVPDFGLINDLLWSDPTDSPNEWEDNERGVSYCYNKVAINKFLNKFGFDLVCRAHMVVEDGYEFFNDRSLVTVFSAPNYCGEFDNWGAVMSVSEGLLCSFELLDPLDSTALKQVMKKGRQERKLANQQQFQGY